MRLFVSGTLLALIVGAALSFVFWPSDRLQANLPPAPPAAFQERNIPSLTPRPPTADYQPPENRFARHEFKSGLSTRVWYGQGPKVETFVTSQNKPAAIVLLHGSNRDGRSMLDMWRHLAQRENITLIAPDASNLAGWRGYSDGQSFLDALLVEASQIYAFDPNRVYLFGHSSGAIHALSLANSGGQWRAVAVHAGGLSSSPDGAAQRHAPLRIYLGDKDHLFPLAQVRAHAKKLAEAGHHTELIVIPNHTHWYYVIGPNLAVDAWRFFKAH
jgi:predicted esterase